MNHLKENRLLILCLLMLAAMGLTTLASGGETAREENTLAAFDRIRAGSVFDMEIRRGDQHRVVFYAEDDVIERISVRVKRNTLVLDFDSKWSERNVEIRAEIETPTLNGLDLSGATDTRVNEGFSSDRFELEISGAADLDLEIDTQTLEVDASGAASVDFGGKIEKLMIDASGAVDLNFRDVDPGIAEIDASGAADIRLGVVGELSADASGAADVDCEAVSKIVFIDESGAGDINCRAQ